MSTTVTAYSMQPTICQPALIYLVIALIMVFIGILMRLNTFNIGTTFCQLSSILLCTLILMGLCAIAPGISWVITIIFIICTISVLIGMIMNWFNTGRMGTF